VLERLHAHRALQRDFFLSHKRKPFPGQRALHHMALTGTVGPQLDPSPQKQCAAATAVPTAKNDLVMDATARRPNSRPAFHPA
jgi:hypothetical protein